MMTYVSKIQFSGSRTVSFRCLLHYSTTSNTAQLEKNSFLEEYLLNSLGFSKQEAVSALKKVNRTKPIKKDPNLVVNYFENLGLNKYHIKSIVSSYPKVLLCEVDKSLKPKIRFLQDLGVSGPALIKVILACKQLIWGRGLDGHFKPRINYLRELLGTDEKVVLALKKYALLLGPIECEKVDKNVLLLQNYGFSKEKIAAFIANNPRHIFLTTPERIEEKLRLVENFLGIPRESTMFYYGVQILCGRQKSTIDNKFDILRSYGWSNVHIFKMVRRLPLTLTMSGNRMRKSLDYFMNELGYTPAYLASRPFLFTLSLEKRVKPRNEVLKILNEKNKSTRKGDLCQVVCLRELKFVQDYLLPYKDEFPNMFESYVRNVGAQQIGTL
ncbi:transcription termination factor MTERF4, chloroplastic-like [Coffea eugenioides]|uniref:Transcription termination factor MTERF4, chloroplastic-like n=1 Tax=Coffea arabica TaxID=13443 RepID=A0A6P6UV76_COFAR|nr:transcription termination factor MTERF4, chloroplastic-like [Coffea arabica]XP_027091019.1 transcription termination factor MTERF4, chloroplastic-like [Coffea arabica]XP_027091021.1 transcription termination factor MTERF4, chloroplastic-like [Coffea arabica]XP_027094254.1 transcription termination factor MTERF4, chloroplastic-like [Coffea arabica]XP_027094255.1 transcription termination factor MTERF4, chloroplastic-like [Coffea arabica]XP_027094256.1 transcription termination factor MTERF4,